MRFTLTVELGNDAIETGADLAELLVRIAPTIESCVGTDLADCIGTVRDVDGKPVGNWTCIEPKMPEARSISRPSTTISNSESLTVRDINTHLSHGSCYVRIENKRTRIRHAQSINGQLRGKSLNRPGEWIAIPPDATVELLD